MQLLDETGKVKEIAEVVEGIATAMPIYQDALQPAAKNVGSALADVTSAVNVALAPLRVIVWGMERIEQWVYSAVGDRLRTVPAERIITPAVSIAGPLIEAMRFAGEETLLRQLYSNLLASAMDAESARNAHPAFVEIIKQLSPDDALLLNYLVEAQHLADARLEESSVRAEVVYAFLPSHVPERGVTIVCWDVANKEASSRVVEASCPGLSASNLGNLARLGLLATHQEGTETVADFARFADELVDVRALTQDMNWRDGIWAHITISAWGRLFSAACGIPGISSSGL